MWPKCLYTYYTAATYLVIDMSSRCVKFSLSLFLRVTLTLPPYVLPDGKTMSTNLSLVSVNLYLTEEHTGSRWCTDVQTFGSITWVFMNRFHHHTTA